MIFGFFVDAAAFPNTILALTTVEGNSSPLPSVSVACEKE